MTKALFTVIKTKNVFLKDFLAENDWIVREKYKNVTLYKLYAKKSKKNEIKLF